MRALFDWLGRNGDILLAALVTYLFITLVEARKSEYWRRREAVERAIRAVQQWRLEFIKDWMARKGGGPSGGLFGPKRDEHFLAEEVMEASRYLPRWKANLIRRALVAMTGDEAVLAYWLGPMDAETYKQQLTDAWFVAFFELQGHFTDQILASFTTRSSRFQHFDEKTWESLLQEARVLETAISAHPWETPLIRIRIAPEESRALYEFGYLAKPRLPKLLRLSALTGDADATP